MEGRLLIKRTITVLGVLVVVIYSGFVLDDFVRGPRIIIESPADMLATSTRVLAVSGRAVHINNLSLNGAPIPFDLKGNFRETILLANGYNRITISATDRYDRTVEKVLELTLKEGAHDALVATTTEEILINQ